MRGINRQVIGFVVGAIFLVIIILVFAYSLSSIGSAEIRYNNIQFFHWFEGGVASAWSSANWADTNSKELKNDGNNNYYIILVPNYTAEKINESFTGDDRKRISDSLLTCIEPNSLCMCLIEVDNCFIGVSNCFNSGLLEGSDLSDWSNKIINCVENKKSDFYVIECKNLVMDGFMYKDDNGNVKFPEIVDDNTKEQIFGIGSDFRSGFEMHKWKNQINITEATS